MPAMNPSALRGIEALAGTSPVEKDSDILFFALSNTYDWPTAIGETNLKSSLSFSSLRQTNQVQIAKVDH